MQLSRVINLLINKSRDVEFSSIVGYENSIAAVSTKGALYVWGETPKEILEKEEESEIIKIDIPTLVTKLSNYYVDKVTINKRNIVVLTHNEKANNEIKIFGFGDNSENQIGEDSENGLNILSFPSGCVPYLIHSGNKFTLIFFKAKNFYVSNGAKCEITNQLPISGPLFAIKTSTGNKFFSSNARNNPEFPRVLMAFTHPIQNCNSAKLPLLDKCQLAPMSADITCGKCKILIKGPMYLPAVVENPTSIICERCFLAKAYGPSVGVYYRISQDHARPSISLPLFQIKDFYEIVKDSFSIKQKISTQSRYIIHPHLTGPHKKKFKEFLESMSKFQDKHDSAIIDLLNEATRNNDLGFRPRDGINLDYVMFYINNNRSKAKKCLKNLKKSK